MALKIQRLRQVAAGILVVLSLCVSSIAACACAHHSHPEKIEVEVPACHQQAHTEETGTQPAVTDSADASCECFLPSPQKVFVKSEKLKIEKQAIAVVNADAVIDLVHTVGAPASVDFYSTIFSISRDFQNLTPGRAPPRL